MKRTIFGLVTVLLSLGLILAGCAGPFESFDNASSRALGAVAPALNANFDPDSSYITLGNETGDHVWIREADGSPYGQQKTVYNFYLQNAAGDRFLSFCGNLGSYGIGELAGVNYLEASQTADIVATLNYINATYGSIDQWSGVGGGCVANATPEANTKLIAQLAIWHILNLNYDAFLQDWDVSFTDTAAIDAAIQDVFANGKTGKGDIDIYFMVGANFPADIGAIQPQIVPIVKLTPCIPAKGDIMVEKTVDGINIAAWVNGNKAAYGFSDINDLISFKLYKVDTDGAAITGAPLATSYLDAAGSFIFTNLDDGWYAVAEALSPVGAKVFEQAQPEYFLITNGITIGGADFNLDDLYKISYQLNGFSLGLNGLLNNGGEVFPMWVSDQSGNTYPTFCANAGSVRFAGDAYNPSGLDCEGYMVASKIDRDTPFGIVPFGDFVKAYNYIDAKYSDLDSLEARKVTQVVTWMLLGAINDSHLDLIAADKLDVAAVRNVMANYKSFSGGKIVDLFYLECEQHHSYVDCQPQLVPIYGGNRVFKNISLPPPPPPRQLSASYGSVTATNADNVPAILAGLNPKNGNPYYGDKKIADTPFVVPNSNHFVFAALDKSALAAGVALDLVVGNNYQIVGKALVTLEGDNLVISVDNMASGSFGAIAFSKVPVCNNGNIHSQKAADLEKMGAVKGVAFNHDNKFVIPCPAGNTVYLYIHFDSVQFYL